MKNYGYHFQSGNISVKLNVDLKDLESGDNLSMETIVYGMHDPYLRTPSGISFLRFFYSMPILSELLLDDFIFPIYASYNSPMSSTVNIFVL